MSDDDLIKRHPPMVPTARLIWTAIIDVADRATLGPAPGGERFMVPILGGTFHAGPGVEGLSGEVLPGGADRQLLRSDGIKELDALYEMRTRCGAIITVHNRVIVDAARKPERYAMSVISAKVQTGRFDWLNRRLLIGTLQSARPERKAVIVRAFEVDATQSEP